MIAAHMKLKRPRNWRNSDRDGGKQARRKTQISIRTYSAGSDAGGVAVLLPNAAAVTTTAAAAAAAADDAHDNREDDEHEDAVEGKESGGDGARRNEEGNVGDECFNCQLCIQRT